jgi:hypothetical protein
MDAELAAAQLRVQELQAQRQLFTAARFAATAQASGVPVGSMVVGAQERHFESIMQSLLSQHLPTDIAPAQIPLVSGQSLRSAQEVPLGSAIESQLSQQRAMGWVI